MVFEWFTSKKGEDNGIKAMITQISDWETLLHNELKNGNVNKLPQIQKDLQNLISAGLKCLEEIKLDESTIVKSNLRGNENEVVKNIELNINEIYSFLGQLEQLMIHQINSLKDINSKSTQEIQFILDGAKAGKDGFSEASDILTEIEKRISNLEKIFAEHPTLIQRIVKNTVVAILFVTILGGTLLAPFTNANAEPVTPKESVKYEYVLTNPDGQPHVEDGLMEGFHTLEEGEQYLQDLGSNNGFHIDKNSNFQSSDTDESSLDELRLKLSQSNPDSISDFLKALDMPQKRIDNFLNYPGMTKYKLISILKRIITNQDSSIWKSLVFNFFDKNNL